MGLHWPPAQLADLVSFIVGIPPDGGGRKPKCGANADQPARAVKKIKMKGATMHAHWRSNDTKGNERICGEGHFVQE